MSNDFDFAVIGGGIVGLATARQLQQCHANARIVLVEKESELARHQTGRNSGVIHAGVYYAPGSLKADFCRRGAQATKDFCQREGIAVELCGKLLVATNELEQQRMSALLTRCAENGIEVQPLSAQELRQREPHIAGVGAIWVPSTGIVDYRLICQRLAQQFVTAGGELRTHWPVQKLSETGTSVVLAGPKGEVQASYLIACAGLQADRIASAMGARLDGDSQREFRIVPFRGEYYRLPAGRAGLINHLIYPIPDPELPFLGVHLTKTIDGGITVGPNAVLGFKREGYGQLNISAKDCKDILNFAGTWPLIKQHWSSGWQEFKDSWFKRGYLNRVQKYCPELTLNDLMPEPVGIRAQAVLDDGSLVHDFLFARTKRSLHVCNAPSPAATSAFPIAEYLVDQLAQQIEA
ncbi:L-2-hydroxyglutarate oxidase [Halioxenophilus aromaticivorans]|uniref:L-2-hydroxyglutarate oxidase n=1 Tax=Halioxenophilus aromaticivorans TaxID=1306992 RepID=A0AAV3TZL9_9ALTE